MTEDYLGTLAEAASDADRADRDQLLAIADRYLRESGSVRRFRAQRDTRDDAETLKSWRTLCELGIIGACVPERSSGSAMTPASGVLLAEVFGRNLGPEAYVSGAFLPTMLLSASSTAAAGHILAAMAAGEAKLVAALQEHVREEGFDRPQTSIASSGGKLVLDGRKRFVRGTSATHFIVSARRNDDYCLALVARDTPGVLVDHRVLADGTSAMDVGFDAVGVAADDILVQGNQFADAVGAALSWTHLAVSAELFGLTTALFGATIEYLRTRRQFDKPLGAFQALQHRAADLYASKEIARFAIAAAIDKMAAAEGDARLALASRCKARAADTAVRVAREAIQMHGAIGFSDEADIGLYAKRVMSLAAWLGGADHHRRLYAQLNPYRVQ